MPPLAPRFDTLGHAERKGLDLFATCNACGNTSEMNLSRLLGHFGPRTSYEQLQPKLRCRKCGKHGATLVARRKCPTCGKPM